MCEPPSGPGRPREAGIRIEVPTRPSVYLSISMSATRCEGDQALLAVELLLSDPLNGNCCPLAASPRPPSLLEAAPAAPSPALGYW
jgi:hypothetical protein